jgi:biotin carboxylase
MGFRIIDNDMDDLVNLYGWVSLSVPYDQVFSILSSSETFPKLMVMELLEEDEYSIDCLADSRGKLIVAVPRRKASGRIYMLDDVPELMEIARKVAEKCRIPFVFNIQVKYNKGVPKLLEINPRMSGGLFITCLSGVNMPYLAVKTIMGKSIERPSPKFGIKASYIELPVLMEG